MPPYAKFLKELCTIKWTTNVPKKAFLASNVGTIISHQILTKYRDLGCPIISIVIGNQTTQKALLELGAQRQLTSILSVWKAGKIHYDDPSISKPLH